jgi:hypothetical protein
MPEGAFYGQDACLAPTPKRPNIEDNFPVFSISSFSNLREVMYGSEGKNKRETDWKPHALIRLPRHHRQAFYAVRK